LSPRVGHSHKKVFCLGAVDRRDLGTIPRSFLLLHTTHECTHHFESKFLTHSRTPFYVATFECRILKSEVRMSLCHLARAPSAIPLIVNTPPYVTSFVTASNEHLCNTYRASCDWRIKRPEDYLGSLFCNSHIDNFHNNQPRKILSFEYESISVGDVVVV